jgi:pilus assembly protein CpaB
MLKAKAPLIASLGLGLLAGIVAYLAIKRKESEVRKGWTLVPVLVAAVDIPQGAAVAFDMIAQREIPEQFVTPSVIRPNSAAYIENQPVRVPLQAGDPFLWTHFDNANGADRLSTKVQKKARAIAIQANKAASVGGWVRPNDHVDVVGTIRDPQNNEQVAVTLLQNVVVLATGKTTGTSGSQIPDRESDYSHVTLLVLPEEAEIIALAAAQGQLLLTLRNESDTDTLDDRASRTNVRTLMLGERVRTLEKQRREMIQIIRGKGETTGGSLR